MNPERKENARGMARKNANEAPAMKRITTKGREP
jgi:hypothetical protein